MISENDLISSAAKGSHSSFEQLVSKYKSAVFNVIYSVCGNTQEADDIAQEVFLKTYFSLASFRGDSKFSTWLYRITVNECLDTMKKKKHNTTSIDDTEQALPLINVLADPSASIEKQMLRNEETKLVRKQILSLPRQYRVIITLKDIENLSYSEISQVMKISLDKVKVWLFRARQKLKEKLQFSNTGTPSLSENNIHAPGEVAEYEV